MSKLSVDQKTIKDLFQDKNADFLIPEYQRPYAWTVEECQTLWDDIYQFAIPNNGNFNTNSEYFLGPIVVFKNKDQKQEVIDGQQRLTTLMLLLRAFYTKFGQESDKDSTTTKRNIGLCLWKTDEFENVDKKSLKIESKVITEDSNIELEKILCGGEVSPEYKSNYATNYRFFLNKIEEFKKSLPTYFAHFPNRLMKNCIVLPIQADNQDTALTIFSTLNDRGMPLSDSDIFKAKL